MYHVIINLYTYQTCHGYFRYLLHLSKHWNYNLLLLKGVIDTSIVGGICFHFSFISVSKLEYCCFMRRISYLVSCNAIKSHSTCYVLLYLSKSCMIYFLFRNVKIRTISTPYNHFEREERRMQQAGQRLFSTTGVYGKVVDMTELNLI